MRFRWLRFRSVVVSALMFFLIGCEEKPQEELRLTLMAFDDLPGWQQDDLATFGPAFTHSCKRILQRPADAAVGAIREAGRYADWQPLCREFFALQPSDNAAVRGFLESNFQPFQVSRGEDPEGLFTGYYEAALRGSLTPDQIYSVPLHVRPADLVMVQLGSFSDDLKGKRIAGRVVNGYLQPYENRTQITTGNWPHDSQVLVWVDDPIDAFFLQIQGSGIVELKQGGIMRVGYDGHNGHAYYPIGRELIKMGELSKEEVSMQSIRAWLERHPEQADQLMNTNQSYIFFREIKGDGPIGGEGVPLTAKRSLAVDKSLLGYGLPIWVDIESPVEGYAGLQRLMMAQDTGGAIKGAVRGDVFWGYGPEAEHLAGHMKSQGRYWILLPKAVIVEAPQ